MKKLNVIEGYNLYSKFYKQEYKHLDSFDWEKVLIILKDILLIKKNNERYKQNTVDVINRESNIYSTNSTNESNDIINIMIFGCADGRESFRIKKLCDRLNIKSEIFGVDISENMIKEIKKKAKKENLKIDNFFLYDFLKPFPKKFENFFDIIIGLFILVHIKENEIKILFENVFNLLKVNSYFLFNNIPQKEGKVLEVNNHKFLIEFYHHEKDDILKNISYFNFELIKELSIFENNKKISDIYLLKKLENN